METSNKAFNNISISKKLALSFGIILTFLLIISFAGYRGLSRSDKGLEQYRELAKVSNLTGQLQTSLLLMQAEFKSYLINNNTESLTRYNTQLQSMKTFLDQANREITAPERVALINEITPIISEYEQAVHRIKEQITIRQNRASQVLIVKGSEMRKVMTELRQYAYQNDLGKLGHHASDLQEALILGRFHLLKYFESQNISDFETAHQQMTKILDNHLAEIRQQVLSQEQLTALEHFNQLRQAYLQAMDDAVQAIRKQLALAEEILERTGPAIADKIEKVKLSVIEDQRNTGPELQASNKQAKNLMGILALTAIFLGIVSAMFFARHITRRLRYVVQVAEQIARGDLRMEKEHYGKDEIGHLQETLYNTSQSLRDMLSSISSASNSISSAAVQLSAVSEQTSKGTQQQLQESDQVASAVDEMAHSAIEVAEHTQRTASATEAAQQRSDSGYHTVTRTLNNIQQLHSSVSQTEQRLENVQKETQNIGSIIDVIQDVAEQTNLLALNAAIEAARAGEQGRGFAVVADEVRSLAQRTHQSTGEIHQLIARLQNSTNQVVSEMQESRKIADTSLSMTEEVRLILEEITAAIETVNDMSLQIASSAEEQSKVAEEINLSVVSVRTIADQSADAARETVIASSTMKQTSEQLQQLISNFRL
ncbi:HAMP domain-containing methyl-accepting chemotaxis protein [Oceanospirillum sediminis]|uniref:HAMP domain-containing protein n=1 Tax=Oceanospirillum sediminis TaxID=2760088 RepID=A0A839IWE6_9GAMM|nr:methyl-accepting chemotaxis protein [Oceanospirillum sediminis]MBB1488944.1 HAMP domain-containing protein [Oceanospirillum sediminis]